MATLEATVDLLQLLGEPTRVRLLALLAREAITDAGQSRVSTHLGKLRDAGLLRDRRAGASTFYALHAGAMPEAAKKIWSLVEAEVQGGVLETDRARCQSVVAGRGRGGGFPDALAGQMERHYSPGRTWEAMARGLIGLLELGDVLDAGSGDGTLAELLCPRARSVTCVDRSERMIGAARERLGGADNVRFFVGDVHELPFDPSSFDQALLFNVLTLTASPPRVHAGGTLALVTLAEHEHAEVTDAYGDVQPGFSPAKLRRMLQKAGLAVSSCDVTSREKRPPHFHVVTALARKG
jgi:SAM-dependent methyltransferase